MRKTAFLALISIVISTFSGCDKAETDSRDIYLGTYIVTETWTENGMAMSKPAFSMSVEKASLNETQVLLNNFANYGAGTTVEATVNELLFTIPQQTLSNLKVISGTGHTDGITMAFIYTEKFNNLSIEITVKAKRK